MPAENGKLFPWWSVSVAEVLKFRNTSASGLTTAEAKFRTLRFGTNELAKQKKLSIPGRLLSKLANPLIILLLVAGGLSAIFGQIWDFIIIFLMTVISVAIDTYQEHSAAVASDKLRKSVSLTATVVRDGIKKEILFAHIVPGDIIFINSGDIVPADGRLSESDDLMIDQSALTGESYPQHKRFESEISPDAPLSDRANCVFMGTHVVSGEGTMIVIATGSGTELGKVAKSLVAERPKTDFEQGIKNYGLFILKIMVMVSALVFIVHLGLARNVLNSLLFVLALSVGFAPELLPVVVTINLSKGALRMSRKGVIVKDLPAIENFGSMDVLCTDKTGTLTENSIKLASFEDCRGKSSDKVLQYAYLTSYFERGLENPLEKAILAGGKQVLMRGFRKVYEVPFDFYRKRMSVVVREGKEHILITKGSPDKMLLHLQHVSDDRGIRPMTHELRESIRDRYLDLSRQGYRVLAVAYRKVEKAVKYKPTDEVNLTFLGFLSFLDPPKKTAKAALSLLSDRGVTVKILTGDNELVTQKVVDELGVPYNGVVLGRDIEHLSDIALMRVVEHSTIFARLNPETKKRIIGALRRNGHVVGFIGDGVNDAPSLRESDIGISVNNAVDVAKESADLILLRKDLHVLIDGVLEGRKTYANVMKYIMMGTSSNFGNMFSVAIASLFLPFLPMLPAQILFNDLLYDSSQLFLANDSVDPESVMKPRKWDIRYIRHFMVIFGPISSVFDCLTFLVLLWFFHATPALFQTGWFLESIVTQIIVIFSIRTVRTPFWLSHTSRWFAFGLWSVVAVALIIPLTFIGKYFSFVMPPLSFYAVLAGIVVIYFLITEFAKKKFYEKYPV